MPHTLSGSCVNIIVNMCSISWGIRVKRVLNSKSDVQVIGISAIRYATYNFLLAFHCHYVSILYHFQGIRFPKKYSLRDPEHIPFGVICHACTLLLSISQHTNFEMPNLIRSTDMIWAPKLKVSRDWTTPVSGVIWSHHHIFLHCLQRRERCCSVSEMGWFRVIRGHWIG